MLVLSLGGWPWGSTPADAATAVSHVAVSVGPPSSAAGAVTSYDIKFVVSSSGALSGAQRSNVTLVLPSGTGFGSLLGFDSTFIDTTTGVGVGFCSYSGETVSCFLSAEAVIGANNHVAVTLAGVTNPGVGSHTLQVSTSSDPTPVTSASYRITTAHTVTTPTVTLTGPSDAAGALTSYTVNFQVSSTGELLGQAGSSVSLTFPAGTGFEAAIGAYGNVEDTTTGQSVGTCSGGALVVPCEVYEVVNPHDHVEVVLDGVSNPGAGSYTLQVSTSSDPTPVASSSYQITAAQQITTPTVSVSGPSDAAGALTGYAVTFGVSSTGGLSGAAGSTITVVFPAGTESAGCTVEDDTTSQSVGSCFSEGSTAVAFLDEGTTPVINPGDQVTITFSGIVNPGVGSYTLQVSTSSDTTPVTSSSYQVVAAHQVTTPSVALSVNAAGAAGVTYTTAFSVSSTGGLAAGSTVTLAFPPGTVLPQFDQGSDPLEDTTTGQQVGVCVSSFSPVSDATCAIGFGDSVNAGDRLTAAVGSVTNPGEGSYTVAVSTSSDPMPVTSSPYAITAPLPVPRIKTFSPSAGSPGTTVVIKGAHLAGALSVTFNGVPAEISANTATSITTDVPEGATTGLIRIQTTGGSATSAKNFLVS